MITRKLKLKNDQEALQLLGAQDAQLRDLEQEHGVEIFVRHDPDGEDLYLSVRGTSPRVQKTLQQLTRRLTALRTGENHDAAAPPSALDPQPPKDAVHVTAYGSAVRPRGPRQKAFVDAILAGKVTFGIGPAGTGKTFLAVACALRALNAHEVTRIVLTRPVVEAGEKLGFLPGDFYDKVHPYLKPLYDAFYTMLGPDKFRMWQSNEIVEVVPLAYMRGRTLDNAFIILDEAQNTTLEQMKMFLTRMGRGSRIVVTGDITQIDLDSPKRSGLVRIRKILQSISDIEFVYLTEEDVVRHPIVRRIVHAFENWEKNR
ncbi:MAG: PhoH family protein [Elusimicrobiota bacterium]